jgi:hypothetical protein
MTYKKKKDNNKSKRSRRKIRVDRKTTLIFVKPWNKDE